MRIEHSPTMRRSIHGIDLQLDERLVDLVAASFTVHDGLFLDGNGNPWMICSAREFETWWLLFEENISSPMGRRLANCMVDEESWHISQEQIFTVSGLFKDKKRNLALKSRWESRGWGDPDLQNLSVNDGLITPFSAGCLHAAAEYLSVERLRMRWQEQGKGLCEIILDPTGNEKPNVIAPPVRPWDLSDCEVGNSPLELELMKGYDVEGERHCLLPAGLFSRLLDACAELNSIHSGENWLIEGESCTDGFIAIAEAQKQVFLDSEQHVLISETGNWLSVYEDVFSAKGLGKPTSVKEIDSHGGIKFTFQHLPFAALTVGMLAGAWQRAQGRPVKVALKGTHGSWSIELVSQYQLATSDD
jgi:hypothetical protein